MSLLGKAANYLKDLTGRNKLSKPQDHDDLFRLISNIWDKCENKSGYVKKQRSYWNGELQNSLSTLGYFLGQDRSNYNIVKSITETKVKNMLDCQFVITVVPDYGSFYDIDKMKDVRDVADIFTDALRGIDKANNVDCIEEQIARDGELCGFGGSQVELSTTDRADGEIKIKYIPAENLRWNKTASQDHISAIGYITEYTPAEAKELYAKLNGVYDEELCKKIDDLSENVYEREGHKSQTGAVLNYVNTANNTGGRAFIEAGSDGIQCGRVVKLVTLYLLDDSVYAPEETDSNETEQLKQEYIKAFPDGRKIVFCPRDNKKVILLDEPAPTGFKKLGNIDVYNHTYTNSLAGKGSIDDIIPIQDRINGLFAKYREKVSFDFDTLIGPDDLTEDGSDIVKSGYTKVPSFNQTKIPAFISSNSMEKAKEILVAIESFVKGAYELAHINQIMMSGQQPSGITSGEQIERLQESPMVDIRAQQRNFKNWKIAVGEKCLLLIIQNYTTQRLIFLTSAIDGAKIAKIDTNNETGEKKIILYKEIEGKVEETKSIDFNNEWKFKVEVIAGTEIPRSRKENAALADKIAVSPIMQSGNIPLIEMYLESQDYPNRRAVVTLLKQQQDAMVKNPHVMTIEDIIKNPPVCTAVSNLFKSLDGFSKAQGQLLSSVGLDPSTNTLTTAPADKITSKSQVKDIAVVVPQQISENPDQIVFGNKTAREIEDKKQVLIESKKQAQKGGVLQ